ncbi:putative MRG [Monocercomonoides exilis]|uniref:putative MRG n=1 Tax=Monocercomonoides exilis TaxID=2049356 RepID=UPI00355A0071|nr:putative MRG [Monocercomonoides exilis]|eukprot:MONOS_824.1-p1 / transcript=MONOS_824.1 / gene=MONOS_824 / organism=Monocercomonoides_exilis_PA203 / gene_product=unspecified product / transcript_product=unspecified product / location=Mono_scaffold00013:216097-217949(+) / protein_length=503 / sequence_SO=supercontig / SO=protein_coding / is_pseudo=false
MEHFDLKEVVHAKSGICYYKAVVMGERGEGSEKQYKVHYYGWSSNHDEWVPPSNLLKDTAENRELSTKIYNEAVKKSRDQKNAGGKKKKSQTDESKDEEHSGEGKLFSKKKRMLSASKKDQKDTKRIKESRTSSYDSTEENEKTIRTVERDTNSRKSSTVGNQMDSEDTKVNASLQNHASGKVKKEDEQNEEDDEETEINIQEDNIENEDKKDLEKNKFGSGSSKRKSLQSKSKSSSKKVDTKDIVKYILTPSLKQFFIGNFVEVSTKGVISPFPRSPTVTEILVGYLLHKEQQLKKLEESDTSSESHFDLLAYSTFAEDLRHYFDDFVDPYLIMEQEVDAYEHACEQMLKNQKIGAKLCAGDGVSHNSNEIESESSSSSSSTSASVSVSEESDTQPQKKSLIQLFQEAKSTLPSEAAVEFFFSEIAAKTKKLAENSEEPLFMWPSDTCGSEHLLRLLLKLPAFLQEMPVSSDEQYMTKLKELLADVTQYMDLYQKYLLPAKD